MNIFLFFLIISQAIFSYFLFTKIEKLQKEKEVDSKNGDLVLPKLKEMPTIEDLDTDSKLLRDVIESAKLEGWLANIQEEPEVFGRTWRIEIQNPTNTLTIRTVLRIIYQNEIKQDCVRIGYFNVGGISFNCDENNLQTYLIIEYLWSLIVEKNEKDYQRTWSSYLQDKEKIENCLTTLKRDRQLKKLFDKSLEDSK
jgi:hypothetical protein